MSNKPRRSFLRSILSAVIEEWGYEAARESLDEIAGRPSSQSHEPQAKSGRGTRSDPGGRAREKPTASTMAANMSLPPTQKQLIQELAIQYDDKKFLPTAGDVRYFFEVHGEVPPSGKQRRELFRRVLKLLSTLPDSALKKILEERVHTGPSRLAPLSEAMRRVGEQRTGRLEPISPSTNLPSVDTNEEVEAGISETKSD